MANLVAQFRAGGGEKPSRPTYGRGNVNSGNVGAIAGSQVPGSRAGGTGMGRAAATSALGGYSGVRDANGNPVARSQWPNPSGNYQQAPLTTTPTVDWNALNGIRSLVESQYADERAAIDDQMGRLRFTDGLRNRNYDQLAAGYRTDRDLGLKGNNLDFREQLIRLANIPQYRKMIADQWALTEQSANQGMNWLDYTDSSAQFNRGIDVDDFANQRGIIQNNLAEQQRQTQGGFVGRGVTGGAAQEALDANDTAARGQMANVDISDRRSAASLNDVLNKTKNDRANLQIDLMSKLVGRQKDDLDLNQTEQLLRLQAERTGLSRQALENQYRKQMAQLGLDRVMSVDQFAQAVEQARMSRGNLNRSVMNDIGNLARISGAVRNQPGRDFNAVR